MSQTVVNKLHNFILNKINDYADIVVPYIMGSIVEVIEADFSSANPTNLLDISLLGVVNYPLHAYSLPYFDAKTRMGFLLVGDII